MRFLQAACESQLNKNPSISKTNSSSFLHSRTSLCDYQESQHKNIYKFTEAREHILFFCFLHQHSACH